MRDRRCSTRTLINGLLLLGIGLHGTASILDERPPVAVSLDPPTIELGDVTGREIVRLNVPLINVGRQTIKARHVESSCGCTIPELPKEMVSPGGTLEISVRVTPGNQAGDYLRNLRIVVQGVDGDDADEIQVSIRYFIRERG
jgi:hypothetical protein